MKSLWGKNDAKNQTFTFLFQIKFFRILFLNLRKKRKRENNRLNDDSIFKFRPESSYSGNDRKKNIFDKFKGIKNKLSNGLLEGDSSIKNKWVIGPTLLFRSFINFEFSFGQLECERKGFFEFYRADVKERELCTVHIQDNILLIARGVYRGPDS